MHLHLHAWVEIIHPHLTKILVTHLSVPEIENSRMHCEGSGIVRQRCSWPRTMPLHSGLWVSTLHNYWSCCLTLSQLQEWCFTCNLLLNLLAWRLLRINAVYSTWTPNEHSGPTLWVLRSVGPSETPVAVVRIWHCLSVEMKSDLWFSPAVCLTPSYQCPLLSCCCCWPGRSIVAVLCLLVLTGLLQINLAFQKEKKEGRK